MTFMTFKQFLELDEDTQQDLDKLTADISAVDAQLAQRTGPLTQRKIALQKMLYVKQKQKEAEDKKKPKLTNQIQQKGQLGSPTATATTTPGGTGQGTPGATASTASTQ